MGVIVEKNENPGCFTKEIFRISNGQVQWENQMTHIGDETAYSKFQSYFHLDDNKSSVPVFEICRLGNVEIPEFHAQLTKVARAMNQVIGDSEVLTVDGFRTVVISENNEFRYMYYLQVNGNPIPVRQEANSPVSFGGAAEGSDIKHVGVNAAGGHGVFSVFSETGRFGIIYHPENSFTPTIVNCSSSEEFAEQVKKQIADTHKRALNYQAKVSHFFQYT